MVIGVLFGFWQWLVSRRDAQDKELKERQAERDRREEEQKRWLEDREAEREKRVEERFQTAVTALGDEKEGTRIGAAILLRTFLHPDYQQFHTQIFDLVVANLRLPRTAHQPEDPTLPLPQPITPFSKALITVFKESFPLVRERLKKENPQDTDSYDPLLICAVSPGIKLRSLQSIYGFQSHVNTLGSIILFQPILHAYVNHHKSRCPPSSALNLWMLLTSN